MTLVSNLDQPISFFGDLGDRTGPKRLRGLTVAMLLAFAAVFALPDQALAQSGCLQPGIWCATMTVGSRSFFDDEYGYYGDQMGALDDTTVEVAGDNYEVKYLRWYPDASLPSLQLFLEPSIDLPLGTVLNVGEHEFEVTGNANFFGVYVWSWNIPLVSSPAVGSQVTVGLRLPNTPATGAPGITGVARVGEKLTADIGTIADTDGLPDTFPDGYTFQWIRVDGMKETNISGANSSTYRPVAADVGKMIKVKVDFTDAAGNSETVTLTHSDPVGVGTITDTGPVAQAWIARFGRTVADQVLEAVDTRLRAAPAPGLAATVAGQAVSFNNAPEGAEALEVRDEEARTALSGTRAVRARDLFTGTSFALTGGAPGERTVSAWGRGVFSRIDGREDNLTLDGEVGNLMLGVDFSRARATAGLMLSQAQGSGGYRGSSAGGIEASLTGLYPYGRYAVSERLSLWGVAGYGEGRLTVEPEEQAALETDMGLSMASVGVRGVLLEAPADGGAELAVKSDAMAVRTTSEGVPGEPGGTGNLAAAEAEVTRLRLGLEGSRAFHLDGGASLVPNVEFGVRHDGGDAETGFGADIGAGLTWVDPARGLSADMRARGLLAHEDGSFSERGLAGSLAWDLAPGSARGPSLSIGQTVGAQASGGVEALLGAQTARALEAANDDGAVPERRTLEAKAGYGFALFDDRWTGTPEVGLRITETGREAVLGWRLEGAGAGGFEVRFEGSRLDPANDAAGYRIGLTLNARR